MSTEMHGHGHDHGHDHDGGGDDINFGKVIAIGVGSLALFAVCTVWAAVILKRETAHIEEKTGRTRQAVVGQAEIGIVDQVPFATDTRLPKWKKERREHLETYGWVDRGKGVVHIPIEDAMAKVAAGAMPAGAPK